MLEQRKYLSSDICDGSHFPCDGHSVEHVSQDNAYHHFVSQIEEVHSFPVVVLGIGGGARVEGATGLLVISSVSP